VRLLARLVHFGPPPLGFVVLGWVGAVVAESRRVGGVAELRRVGRLMGYSVQILA